VKEKIFALFFILLFFSACGAGVEFKDLNGQFKCVEGCTGELERCTFPINITATQNEAAIELKANEGQFISLLGAVNENNSIYLNDSSDLCSFVCGGSVTKDEINLDCIALQLVEGTCKMVYPYCQIARYQRVSND